MTPAQVGDQSRGISTRSSSARGATGSAGALYLAFYYLGATCGSVLPGYAWQTWGWHGVAATCGAGLALALLADWLLCGREAESRQQAAGSRAQTE